MWHRKKKKKNNTKYSGHIVSQQCPRAAHILHSDQHFLDLALESFNISAFVDGPGPQQILSVVRILAITFFFLKLIRNLN